MTNRLDELIIEAHAETFKVAFETAVRTGTALIYYRNGKIVRIYPQFEYKLVPIKPKKKSRKSTKKGEVPKPANLSHKKIIKK